MKFKNSETDSTPVTFLCKPELKQDIEAVAAIEGISASDVIRRAVLFDVRRRKAADQQPEEIRPHVDAVDGRWRSRQTGVRGHSRGDKAGERARHQERVLRGRT